MRGPIPVLSRHRGAAALLAGHAVVFWMVVGAASPWATVSLECAPGAMAEAMLEGTQWSVWDLFHGALGGMFVSSAIGLPVFAALGVTGFAVKLLTWAAAAALLLIVYVLLDRHESRRAALLAVAGLAFCPPVLFHPSLVFGNWHWTQLIFDYGLVLAALEIARRPRGSGTWLGFGLLTGLALFNCVASLPFAAVAWLVLLAGAGVRANLARLAVAGAGVVVGAAPFLYKAAVHRPFGLEPTGGDQTIGRLRRLGFDPLRATDLVYPELPWSLHVHDALSGWPLALTWRMEGLWTAVVWAGLVAAAVFAFRQWRSAERGRGLPVATVPVLFVAAFVAAYVVVDSRLQMLPMDFTNVRESSHRMLPPLIAALLVGSAIGWSRLAVRHPAAGRLLLGLAAVPAAFGLMSQLALVQPAAPAGEGGPSAFRASCGDVLGFFAASSFAASPADGLAVCGELGGEDLAASCRMGMGWGAGFHNSRLTGLPAELNDGRYPPGQMQFSEGSRAICEGLAEARADCFFGLGWHSGAGNWGRGVWPVTACETLSSPDREDCWRGVGFPVGDHLHPMPSKAAALLERVPAERRDLVARGMGFSIGRTYASRPLAEEICRRIGARDADACIVGVGDHHDPR